MSTDNESAEPRRIRTSDAERERVAAMLRNAVAEGRLSLEEGDERLAALYQMKFRDELGALTVDLPRDDPPAGTGRRGRRGAPTGDSGGDSAGGPGWGGPGWGPGWGGGQGSGGWGGPGWGGPGWGGPGGSGNGPTDESGQPAGAPGGPGYGHGPWGHHHYHRHPLRRLAFVALLIFAIATISGGHFFWPIIPIAFVTLAVLRCGAFAMWRRASRGQWSR